MSIPMIPEREAPDAAVKRAIPDYPETPQGSVSRRARIQYFLKRQGYDELTDFVDKDVDSVIALFDDFNRGTHGSAGAFDLSELRVIKERVESPIRFLHRLVRPRN